MDTHEAMAFRSAHLAGTLDERGRRTVAASEALVLGRGGIMAVARATGLSRKAIALGIRELRGEVPPPPPGRVRRAGGGRKSVEAHDPTLRTDLERLVEPSTRGDPESPLRWTSKSVRRLAAELSTWPKERHANYAASGNLTGCGARSVKKRRAAATRSAMAPSSRSAATASFIRPQIRSAGFS